LDVVPGKPDFLFDFLVEPLPGDLGDALLAIAKQRVKMNDASPVITIRLEAAAMQPLE
jgi:hypothetical protein